MELAERRGLTAALLPFLVGMLIAALVFAAHSIAAWFDNRNMYDPFPTKENP